MSRTTSVHVLPEGYTPHRRDSNIDYDSDLEHLIPRHDEDDDDVEHEIDITSTEPLVQHSTNHHRHRHSPPPANAFFVRALALLCACSLSIGSHYASYILGPLKSRLTREMGTNNTEFSLLLSALSLNSTWTPLVGGIMASRLGTTYTSILATGVIFAGQALLLIGDLTSNVRLMAFGLFVFGLGVSPLAVVQETIIVRFFRTHGLGVSLALGLVAGKGASFISARISFPLSEKFGPHAPFVASTCLAGFSVFVNGLYVLASRWIVRESGTELEAAEVEEEAANQRKKHGRGPVSLSEEEALAVVAKKRKVDFRRITKLGDVFWAYIGLNVLCGTIWSPFTHLAANIIQVRYNLTDLEASNKASYLLAGSVILYPICGYITDRLKNRPIVIHLLMLSGSLTLICYIWLALPPSWTKGPDLAIAAFGIGNGFSPLLLVLIVPQIVPLKYVSTTLGAHKSLEQAGSTISQTLIGLLLDVHKKVEANPPPSTSVVAGPTASSSSMQYLLYAFVSINIIQLVAIFGLSYLDKSRKRAIAEQAALHIRLPSAGYSLHHDNDSIEEFARNGGEGEGDDDDESRTVVAKLKMRQKDFMEGGYGSVDNSDNEESPTHPNFHHRPYHPRRQAHPSLPSTSSPSQRVPLLHSLPPSQDPNYLLLCADTVPRSQLDEDSRPCSPPLVAVRLRVEKSKRECVRGEVFAAASVVLILVAWVLFMCTAYWRLRSKQDRAGS